MCIKRDHFSVLLRLYWFSVPVTPAPPLPRVSVTSAVVTEQVTLFRSTLLPEPR